MFEFFKATFDGTRTFVIAYCVQRMLRRPSHEQASPDGLVPRRARVVQGRPPTEVSRLVNGPGSNMMSPAVGNQGSDHFDPPVKNSHE
jgi:hypothetical protein